MAGGGERAHGIRVGEVRGEHAVTLTGKAGAHGFGTLTAVGRAVVHHDAVAALGERPRDGRPHPREEPVTRTPREAGRGLLMTPP